MSAVDRSLSNRPQTSLGIVGLVAGVLALTGLAWIMPLAFLFLILALVGLIALAMFVRWPHLFLYTFVFFLPYEAEFSSSLLSGATLNPQNMLNTALLVILLLRLLPSWRIPSIPSWGRWNAFVLLSAVSLALGPLILNPLQGAWVVYRLAIVAPLTYLGVLFFLHTPAQARRMMVVLTLSASVAGLVGVIQAASGGQVLGGIITNHRYLGLFQPLPATVVENFDKAGTHLLYLAGTNIYRGHGTFYTNNVFGAFLSVTACLTWGLLRGVRSWRRWAWFLALAAQLAGLIATFSRSTMAALMVALIVAIGAEIVLVGRRKAIIRAVRLIPFVILTTLLALLIALQFETVIAHFTTLLHPEQVTEFQWRQLVWDFTIHQILERPWLGFGTGILRNVPSYFVDQDFGPHNMFLEVAYRSGLITLSLFVIFTWQWLRTAWCWSRQAETPQERVLAIGVLAAGIAFLVSGMASSLMGMDNMTTLFWCMVGIAMAMNRRHKYVESKAS